MKIRTAFVSNSSSSSYIIAYSDKEEECLSCKKTNKWVLQAIGKYISCLGDKQNRLQSMLDSEWVEEHFKTELKEHEHSIGYAECQIKAIKELEANPEIYEHYEKVHDLLERGRFKTTVEKEAEMAKYVTPQESLKSRREHFERHLVEHEKKQKELKDLIKKIKKAIKDGKVVYSLTIDNWATDAEEVLKQMIKDEVVEVIHSIHT